MYQFPFKVYSSMRSLQRESNTIISSVPLSGTPQLSHSGEVTGTDLVIKLSKDNHYDSIQV